jgi:prepilin-type N-terminal cleavage/methylation domain-containing protein
VPEATAEGAERAEATPTDEFTPRLKLHPSRRAPLRAAFTLIEIVLVLALMAVAASVVIANFVAFADRGGELSAEETLYSAVRSARFQAASSRRTTELRFDKETGSLTIGSDTSFPLNEHFAATEAGEIRFFLAPPTTGLSSFADPADSRLETKVVRFAPDRSSSPFVAEIDSGHGTPQRLVFDPFSSLVRRSE